MKTQSPRMKRLAAVLIGITFLVAGLLKLLDPVGAGLVMDSYFKFFHLPFLHGIAKAAGVAFALVETLLGAALVAGVWRRPVARITFALLALFTLLTLVLAIARPQMDCGCFGEAVHLTHFQTLLKNVILLALALFAFLPFGELGTPRRRKYVSFGLVAAAAVFFAAWSLRSVPLVDFTDFRPGSELLAAVEGGEDRTQADYESMFIYRKNGQEGAFPLDRLPDSTWTYVRTETILRNRLDVKERVPMLSFTDTSGRYCDDLAAHGQVLAVSVYDVPGLPGEAWTEIAATLDAAASAGFTPLLLASSSKAAFDSLATVVGDTRESIDPYFYTADFKTLVTLNRSNGGATWLSDGLLIRKYPRSALPAPDTLLELTGQDPTEVMLHESTRGRLRFQGILFYAIGVLLLI